MKVTVTAFIPRYDLKYKSRAADITPEERTDLYKVAESLISATHLKIETESGEVYIPGDLCKETIIFVQEVEEDGYQK